MPPPLLTDEEFAARDIVKVVTDLTGHALYFSRAPIGSRPTALRHIGIYGYRAEALARFTTVPPPRSSAPSRSSNCAPCRTGCASACC